METPTWRTLRERTAGILRSDAAWVRELAWPDAPPGKSRVRAWERAAAVSLMASVTPFAASGGAAVAAWYAVGGLASFCLLVRASVLMVTARSGMERMERLPAAAAYWLAAAVLTKGSTRMLVAVMGW